MSVAPTAITDMPSPSPTTFRDDRERLLLVVCGLDFFVLHDLMFTPWNLAPSFMIGAPWGRDFVNFWLGGRLAIEQRLDLLANLDGYNDLLAQTFAHSRRVFLSAAHPAVPGAVRHSAVPCCAESA
jgi:hypothetical protein